ncbi:hypothetical protein C1752_00976 [Acaryochloris thomasi RCC1774]|uniref:ABC transporter substrate-binding protein n=1 Tax=Acaryochloris thomasi RCC1774 TaxID=1764569 RepID=A0A2W1JYQ0_9CYAN|nr:substrate-binding domain-containing protein [Acaryochloris thomasi]PZD74604.1 hypothetical protein C1752_00976 [Acaryochloris thomasi RCC1774]
MAAPQNPLTRTFASVAILLASLGIAYIPIPGLQQTIVVVSGTELQEPLQKLQERFQQANPSIQIDLKFQGSQDLVNNYVDDKNDFKPTVLIPANGELLAELESRWQSQQGGTAFQDKPQPIAKTRLVAIAWPQRGKALFPNGTFQWSRLEVALQKRNWSEIGGSQDWGSFDFITTDPTRSNSGQLTLSLWAQDKVGTSNLNPANLSSPTVQTLVNEIKRSVYQPPRSTDVLLREFITRGPNDADIATVYESIALYRWSQSKTSRGEAYQIYYLNPTIETVATAAIVRREVGDGEKKAARTWLKFLAEPDQQAVFVEYGFRPTTPGVKIEAIPNNPWQQDIPGAKVDFNGQVTPPPDRPTVTELIRLWQRGS